MDFLKKIVGKNIVTVFVILAVFLIVIPLPTWLLDLLFAVNIALSVLEELNIHIPVCGMVKDDNHRTRGLYYNNVELPIDSRSEGFKLITRIQDEAHRFAIEYHRSLRSKSQVKSVLDEIPGVGPARRKALMRHFKSIEDVKNATVEELCRVPEIPVNVAEQIAGFFAAMEKKR